MPYNCLIILIQIRLNNYTNNKTSNKMENKTKIQSTQNQKVILKGYSNVSLITSSHVSFTQIHPLHNIGNDPIERFHIFIIQKSKALEPMNINDSIDILEVKAAQPNNLYKKINEYEEGNISSSFHSSQFI